MSEQITYAFRIDTDKETPCHLSEIKQGDVFYQVNGDQKSELRKAIGDAFSTVMDDATVWSIPYEQYE